MTILVGGIFVGPRRNRQDVMPSVLKPAFAPILATIFGLVQLICACAAPMDAAAMDFGQVEDHHASAAAPMDMPGHCDDKPETSPDAPHEMDCAHCGDAQITAVADVSTSNALADLSSPVVLTQPTVLQDLPASRSLAPERYRRRSDPPRPTPVTLKLRLLV